MDALLDNSTVPFSGHPAKLSCILLCSATSYQLCRLHEYMKKIGDPAAYLPSVLPVLYYRCQLWSWVWHNRTLVRGGKTRSMHRFGLHGRQMLGVTCERTHLAGYRLGRLRHVVVRLLSSIGLCGF